MAKTTVVRKPLSLSEYKKVKGHHPLSDLVFNTGARLEELSKIIKKYDPNKDYIDIPTKKSEGTLNRFYLNKKAKECLEEISKTRLYGKGYKTLYREFQKISRETKVEFTAHNLRATACTIWLMMGNDLVTVQTLMHHADISQTAKYVQFSEFWLRAALESPEDVETFEGMTTYECKKEIISLRARLRRLEFFRDA